MENLSMDTRSVDTERSGVMRETVYGHTGDKGGT